MPLWLGHLLAEDVKDLRSCTTEGHKSTEGVLEGSTLRPRR